MKLAQGCAECGYNKCARALQFHHPDPNKDSTVSRMANSGRAWSLIEEEMAKCILLCANCHHEEHERIRASELKAPYADHALEKRSRVWPLEGYPSPLPHQTLFISKK